MARPAPTEELVTAQELRVAVGRVARRLRRITAEHESTNGLSFTQVTVLVRLAREGPSSPSALAAHEQVTSQAIAAVVRDLEARGLVTRTAHSSDGRRTLVSISSAGRATLWSRKQAALDAVITTLEESYSTAEVRRLGAVVPLLNRLADLI